MRGGQTYRADIDGLRAIAVISVVLFHLQINWLGGGFAGVDVFFVISGYLITRLLVTEIEATGSVSFNRFYLRRLRRLFPALAATLIGSFLAAAVFFGPEYFQRASESTIAAALSVSNILFWMERGYFDLDALTKPLLHTWSLSVEEQFYLVWPAILLLFARLFGVRALFWTVTGVGVLSFALNIVVVDGHSWPWISNLFESPRDALFFLTPFRMFELAIGAAIVWTERLHRPSKITADTMVAGGLALIVGSFLILTEEHVFPYVYALPPCLGAALIIHGGREGRLAQMLSISPMQFIGKISYSLYLVHWPLIVFYIYQMGDILTPSAQGALCMAAIALAAIMYHFIEQPFRRARTQPFSNAPYVSGCAALGLVIVAPAVHAAVNGGWPWRIPEEIRVALTYAGEQRQERIDFDESLNADQTAPFTSDGRKKLLLIGDSMTRDLKSAIAINDQLSSHLQVRRLSIPHTCQFLVGDRNHMEGFEVTDFTAEDCAARVDSILDSELLRTADAIMVWQRWYDWAPRDAVEAAMIALRKRTSAELYILGRKMEFHPTVAELLRRSGLHVQFEQFLFTSGEKPEVNKKISEAAQAVGAHFIDPTDIQCENSKCFAFARNGKLLYWDWGHWSLDGSAFFASRFSKSPELAKALGINP